MSSFKIFSARQYYIPRASRPLASRHKNSRIYWQCNILSHTAGIATTTCPCIRDSNVHSSWQKSIIIYRVESIHHDVHLLRVTRASTIDMYIIIYRNNPEKFLSALERMRRGIFGRVGSSSSCACLLRVHIYAIYTHDITIKRAAAPRPARKSMFTERNDVRKCNRIRSIRGRGTQGKSLFRKSGAARGAHSSCYTRKVAARAWRPLPMDFCSTVALRCGPHWLARLSPLRYRKMRSKPRNQEIGRLLPYTHTTFTTTTPLPRQKEGRPSPSLSTVIVASLVISPSLFHISTRTHTTHTHVYIRYVQFI
ncbi:unnamed protein product [Trichogramma brassicae]|uniref:Uncharacterized protein n=1 Tax=Trichogramma brassicae TaxID=86971 RepID=A0A6H5IU92_9HYME|nr:unnamed protein product [Trichogramma brassicae]